MLLVVELCFVFADNDDDDDDDDDVVVVVVYIALFV